MSIYDISYKHNIYNDRYIIENTIFIITILPLPEQKKKIYIEMVLKYYYEYSSTSNINYNKFILDHINKYDKVDVDGFIKLFYIADIISNY